MTAINPNIGPTKQDIRIIKPIVSFNIVCSKNGTDGQTACVIPKDTVEAIAIGAKALRRTQTNSLQISGTRKVGRDLRRD